VTILSRGLYLLQFKFLFNCALEKHSNTRMHFQYDKILRGPQNIPQSAVAPSVLLNEYFVRLISKRIRWVGHAERTGRTTAGHFVSVGEHKGK